MFQRLAAAALLASLVAACSTTVAMPTTPDAAAPAEPAAAAPAAEPVLATVQGATGARAAPAAAPKPQYPLEEAAALAIAAKLGLQSPTTVLYRNAEKHERAHGVKVKGDKFDHFVWMMNTGKRRVCVDATNGDVLEDIK